MWKSKRKNPVYQCSVFVPCPCIHSKSPVSAHVFLDTSLSSIATSRSLLWALCGLCCLMKSWSHSLIDIHNEIQPDVWPSPHMNLVYDQLITKHIFAEGPKALCKEFKFSGKSSPNVICLLTAKWDNKEETMKCRGDIYIRCIVFDCLATFHHSDIVSGVNYIMCAGLICGALLPRLLSHNRWVRYHYPSARVTSMSCRSFCQLCNQETGGGRQAEVCWHCQKHSFLSPPGLGIITTGSLASQTLIILLSLTEYYQRAFSSFSFWCKAITPFFKVH